MSYNLPSIKRQSVRVKVTYRNWTTWEIRYIRQHRSEGAAAIAAVLSRSEQAVRKMAAREGISWRVKAGEVCPFCGNHEVRQGTSAAQHGMCISCWNRHLADLRREAEAEARTNRLREAAKKAAQRSQHRFSDELGE